MSEIREKARLRFARSLSVAIAIGLMAVSCQSTEADRCETARQILVGYETLEEALIGGSQAPDDSDLAGIAETTESLVAELLRDPPDELSELASRVQGGDFDAAAEWPDRLSAWFESSCDSSLRSRGSWRL